MPARTETVPSKLDWPALLETALTMPGNVGNTYSRFYEYSFLNQCLLAMQGVREPVATYKRWQSIGRQVLKGSKAKEIVRPIIIEKKDTAGTVEERKVLFKAVRCLFGYSETEGEELPPVEPRGWDLATALDTLKVHQVPFELLDGNTAGYSYDRNFAINPVAVHPIKTRFHELSHIVSGHTTPEKLGEYATHRGVMEFEAEGSAFLVMNELEAMDEQMASESRGYCQGWMRDQQPPESSIRKIFSTTDVILKAGRLTVEAEM